jgi:hypothetical protein
MQALMRVLTSEPVVNWAGNEFVLGSVNNAAVAKGFVTGQSICGQSNQA